MLKTLNIFNFLLINSIYYLSKRSGHGVMASAFHQKRQVADLLGINLFKKKKKKRKKKENSGVRLATNMSPKPHKSGSFVH